MLNSILRAKLEAHAANNLIRKRRLSDSVQDKQISFSSNDYLGLAQDPQVIEACVQGAKKYGVGSTGSQVVSGHMSPHQELEQKFAQFLQRDRALLFNNGYMANLGILQAIAHKNDSIYEDKYNHASLIDAGLLSRAQFKRYPHQDYEQLKRQLSKDEDSHKIILSDSVFSMSGKIVNINQLVDIRAQYQASLVIDDAHGIGVLGETGAGITELFNLTQKEVPILVCPLGKAFGGFGAIVAGSELVIESIMQFARTYIYTTAIPPAIAASMIKSLELIQTEPWRREQLQKNIEYFKKGAAQRNLPILNSNTPIQVLITKDNIKTLELSQDLAKQNLQVSAIRPPTVPINTARLRISLSSQHTQQHIDQLLDAIKGAYEYL